MARRDGQTSGPKKQSDVNDASRGEGSPSLSEPQEAGSHIGPFDQVSQAVGELEMPGVTVPTLHESKPDLATELLETVSASAIQLHPEEPTETTPVSAEGQESHAAGATQHPQTSASSHEDGAAKLAAANAELIQVLEDPVDSAESTSESSGHTHENVIRISLESTHTPDSPSVRRVNKAASGWRGPTADPSSALVSPFGLVRAVVEANLTVWSYLQKESQAALAHLQALSSVRSPTEVLDLQSREASRSLQSALNLRQELAESSERIAEGLGSASKGKQ